MRSPASLRIAAGLAALAFVAGPTAAAADGATLKVVIDGITESKGELLVTVFTSPNRMAQTEARGGHGAGGGDSARTGGAARGPVARAVRGLGRP